MTSGDRIRHERYFAKMRANPTLWQEHLSRKQRWQRRYSLKRKFGISLEDYEWFAALQGGCCAICGHRPQGEDSYRKGKGLAVDHDHRSGRIRGLLCDRCNRGLGHFRDDPVLLGKAVAYLS